MICGSSLNLFFSYYRSPPLWISIKWNALFLAINAALIALMWKEDKDAEEHGKDPEQVWAELGGDGIMNALLSGLKLAGQSDNGTNLSYNVQRSQRSAASRRLRKYVSSSL